MRRYRRPAAVLLAAVLFAAAPPLFAEERVYSVAVNPPTDDYVSPFNAAVEAGVRGQTAVWAWNRLEPSPGKFDLLEAAESIQVLCKERQFTVLLTLLVVDGNGRATPADLAETPFDSEAMKRRFHALIDSIAPLMDKHVRYLSVGSEVDLYLSRHPDEWGPYERFYQDAADYIHQKIPDVKVGACVTHKGAAGPDSAKVSSLNKRSDVWVTTYYGIKENFRPAGPEEVLSVLPAMVSAAGSLPVVIQEIGYPSSLVIGSSEKDQAAFVSNVFDAWAAAGDKIQFLNFWLMYDLPENEVEQQTVLKEPGQPSLFKAFIGSLGLHRADGTPKEAWSLLLEKAKEAGFIG